MTDIPLTPIVSTNIEAVGYDEATREGRIKFKDRVLKDGAVRPGATYAYYEAPAEIFTGMLNAATNHVSPSKYLDDLRRREVRYEKLPAQPSDGRGLIDPNAAAEAHSKGARDHYSRTTQTTAGASLEEAARLLHAELEGRPEYGGSIQVTRDALEVSLAPSTATSPAIRHLLHHGYLGHPVIAVQFED